MRTKILSMMIIAAMIAVLFAGMVSAAESAQAPEWTVGDKWAFGADEDLNTYAEPYVQMMKQEAAASGEVSDVDVTVKGTAGAWATFEVTGATDTEYTLHYRMSESVSGLKVHASVTADMPDPGTYSYMEAPPTSQRTMSADVSLDHATVVSGDMKFVRDTMAVKSITIEVEQKTAFSLVGKNLPGEDMLMGDMMGGLVGTGGYDDGYDSGYDTGVPQYPELSISSSTSGSSIMVTIDSVSGDLTWGNMNIDVYDVNVTLLESVYGTDSATFTVYHADGTLATDSDTVQAGDYLIIDAGAGVDNLDFFYEDSYYGLVYLESIYNLADSSTRGIYDYDSNYTVSYQDYDISFTEEYHSSITINFEPPLNLLDFPINVGDQWRVYSNITVSGTYGGTIDASGLPDEVVQEIRNETGQDFPIDIAKLDMGDSEMANGKISGSSTVDFNLECTGTMQITDENGNTLTVFKISPYYEYSYWKGDTEPSVLYSPDKKFVAGTYIPAGASPVIPGMSGSASGSLSLLGGAATSDTTFTYADYDEASSNIDKTDTSMSSIGEPGLFDLGNPMFLLIILGVVVVIVILALVMRKKKPQQPGPQMAPYPDPYAPQQPQYQGQPQQPPAYYPPPQPQQPPQPPQNQYQGPPQNQTPPPPTY